MGKNNRPVVENPLANMGLDEIVRGITSETSATPSENTKVSSDKKKSKATRRGNKLFEENLAKYTGVSEQGVAIWLPKEVKKQLELVRLNASKNIPLRALASAIITTYIAENEEKINGL
ncbi:MAG: hypothetical protein IKC18_06995 [Bacteroidaceae bacterium]|nr:hypothetical protein [Bacteroidaceae bacterium]